MCPASPQVANHVLGCTKHVHVSFTRDLSPSRPTAHINPHVPELEQKRSEGAFSVKGKLTLLLKEIKFAIGIAIFLNLQEISFICLQLDDEEQTSQQPQVRSRSS